MQALSIIIRDGFYLGTGDPECRPAIVCLLSQREKGTPSLDIQLGISQGLRHAPLRFFVVADHLEK